MHILIVSATHLEVKPLIDVLDINYPMVGLNVSNKKISGHRVDLLVTGVGMVNTAFIMGRYINVMYDLVMNVGICGAFDRSLEIGQMVNITEDILSEMGAEDGNEFLTLDKLNLSADHIFSCNFDIENKKIEELKKVKGITVNTIHGNDLSIEKIKKLYNPAVESMEGAAFFSGCRKADRFIQLRAVSNYVEKRDKSKWNIPLAVNNLNDFVVTLITDLSA